MQQQPWLEARVSSALREANGLANSYRNGTVWFLVRTGRSMTQQFRDLLYSYCALSLIISLNACQLIAQVLCCSVPVITRCGSV